MKYCSKCGAEASGKFCSNCGCSLQVTKKKKQPSKIAGFFKAHKGKIIAITALSVALITTVIVLVATLGNIFRIGKVSAVKLGMTETQVERILGEPTEKEDSTWYYYEDKAAKIFKKAEEIDQSISEDSDFEDVENALEELDELYSQLEEMTFKYIMVRFVNDQVSKVYFDCNHKYDMFDEYATAVEKKVKSVELEEFTVIEKIQTSADTFTYRVGNLQFSAKFQDGSYICAKATPSVTINEEKTQIKLTWQDVLCEYSAVKNMSNMRNCALLSIDNEGALVSVEKASGAIVLPNSVTSIKTGAFNDCGGLTSVELSENITLIGQDAFDGCSFLESIKVNENNKAYSSQDGILYNKEKTEFVHIPKRIQGTITIPDSVTSIGYEAFYGCSSLTSVVIPDSVTSIGDRAFYGCSNLTSVTIGDGVTSIGSWAFAYCSSLTSVVIPDSVTSIGYKAFYDTGYYNDEHNWENGVLYIGKYLIEVKDTIADEYTVKDGTLCIGNCAFYNCSSLTSVAIPDSVTSIGDEAFEDCSSLTSVKIPDGVTSIGDRAFYECSSLTSVVIGDSVTSIGEWAFEDCSSLTIYCEAESKPSGWSSSWNSSNRPVVWGYTAEE